MSVQHRSTTFRTSLQVALVAGLAMASISVAVAADPTATQADFDVEVYSQQGATRLRTLVCTRMEQSGTTGADSLRYA